MTDIGCRNRGTVCHVSLVAVTLLLISQDAPAVAQTFGLWASQQELREKPMVGPAWQAVFDAANTDTSAASLAYLHNDPTNTSVLAAAIVSARTGETAYEEKVVTALDQIVQQGRPAGNSLAWARNVGTYALAADLIDYRTPEFETMLQNVVAVWPASDGRTLREMFQSRPANWGTSAFGSLTAVYSYLGDWESLTGIRQYWIQGVTGPNPGYSYGRDLSWQADEENPVQINPLGATKNGMLIDGFLPEEMRRGGPLQDPPILTNYVWEAQQGLVMAARILERVGMPIWDVADQALYRAAHAYQVRLGGEWTAKGDDLWLLPFYDDAYRTSWSVGQDERIWEAGKIVGWPYVLDAGNEPSSCDFDGGGCGLSDLDALVIEISSGTNTNATFDITGDNRVDGSDLERWLKLAGEENLPSVTRYLAGDANLNGAVDDADFAVWMANRFTTTGKWSLGDFNADGVTNVSDFNLWNDNKTLDDNVALSLAPEPGNSLLILLGVAYAYARRRLTVKERHSG